MGETSFDKFLKQLRRRTMLGVIVSFLVMAGFVGGMVLWSGKYQVKGETISSNRTINGVYGNLDTDLTIARGVTITHDQGNTSGGATGMELRAKTLTLEPGATIDVSGKGYKGSWYSVKDERTGPAGGSEPGEQIPYGIHGLYWSASRDTVTGGGDWNHGGAGGGSGSDSATRGGAGGGGGGAVGAGSGGKSNYPNNGLAYLGGGGAGWNGQGGKGMANYAIDETGNGTMDEWIDPTRYSRNDIPRFGGGGGQGVNKWIGYDYNQAGNGGGAVKIIADTLKMGDCSRISARGEDGTYYATCEGIKPNKCGLNGAGGGGTIHIEVTHLEISTACTTSLDVRGGDGLTLQWGDRYSTSGSGGGGLIFIKIADGGDVKVGNTYYGDGSDGKLAWYDEIRNFSNYLGGRPLINNIHSWGKAGKLFYQGHPIVPGAGPCQATLNLPLFTNPSSPQGKDATIEFKIKYDSSFDDPSLCPGKVKLRYNILGDFGWVSDDLDGEKSSLVPALGPNAHQWERPAAGSYTATVKVKPEDNACAKINPSGYLQAYQTYTDSSTRGNSSPTADSKVIAITCPNIAVSGDIGAGGDISADNLTLIGPAVVSVGGTANYRQDISAGSVTKLESYASNFDFNQIKRDFNNLKNQRARRLGANRDLNLYHKPEGGVWKLETSVSNLNINNFTNSGVIFSNHSLTIDNLSWAGRQGTLGLVVDGDVVIKDHNLKNAAIFATGKISFDFSASADISGVFIGNSIDLGNISGNISWAPALLKAPPPGFTNLLRQIKLVNKAPK